MMQYFKTKNFARLLGIFIFIIIFIKIDVHKLLEILSELNFYHLAAASFLIIVLMILKAIRWQLLMKAHNIDYSLKDSIIMYAASVYVGAATPGKIGDLVKVLYLKNDNYPFGMSFVTVILDRLFDIASLLFLGYFGMLLFHSIFENVIFILSLVFFGVFLLVALYFHKKKYVIGTLKNIASNLLSDKNRVRAMTGFSDIYNGLKTLNIIQFASATLITFMGWLVYFLAMYLLALSINIDISFLYLATCVSISAFITLIPVSISGIGTRDATMVILFSFVGLNPASAVAFSTLVLFLYIVNGVVGLLAWMKKPIHI